MTVLTIGVYGFSAASFFAALDGAHVTDLVDIRRRRGVRGREYAFANATALEQATVQRGMRYLAVPQLAPTAEIRALQAADDARTKVRKRLRTSLSVAFVEAYEHDVLGAFDESRWNALLASVGDRPCLLCVETSPSACHRGLAATALAARTSSSVEHLTPG